ncbi:exodeoxyribonuclease III [Nakamurella lactea]|uniref:exodeoxyribonuclease III n=1 Tax=Nakamurella lactea TaxID=459515 RepID=UPI000422EE84|nr:exodeoxyribonuclease III [Nakamurella lactea]
MRVAAFNVNGIRAAVRRGYVDWQRSAAPDIVCLQEVRAPVAQVPPAAIDGYHFSYHEGDRAGRNGVAVLSRVAPSAVRCGFSPADGADGADDPDGFDAQGRYLEVDLPGLTVASLYLPKGDVYGEKYAAKMRFLALLQAQLAKSVRRSRRSHREFLVCGDFNIAPAEADIRSWKSNLKSEGFLPQERDWFGEQTSGPLVDVVRQLRPDEVGPFSWWTWRGQAFDNDAGWRIDHQLATPALAARAERAWVDRAESYPLRMSDHAPVLVDYGDKSVGRRR